VKNRYGDEYEFVQVDENTYTVVGNLKYWRYGGREGQAELDSTNLGFADPSGGPFIELGMKIADREITRICLEGERILFKVAK
jgi:hypothetical protein